MSKKVQIPKLVHTFFKWYCRSERYEELHGDLEEFFYDRVEEQGLRKARLLYLFDVIRCCQPYAWKRINSQTHSKLIHIIMLKNYFKTSIRSMMRNPLSSFINIFGLSVAIGICLVVYGFLTYDVSIDSFHEKKNEIYLTTFFADKEGTQKQYGEMPRPLGQLLNQDFAQLKSVCRVNDRNTIVKYEDRVFHEQVRYTDPEFLEMLSFPLKWGNRASLADVNSVILSDEMSIKYFGNENPIGKDLLLKFDMDNSKTFTITGVAQSLPKAHAIKFNFLINFENMKIADPNYDVMDWNQLIDALLVEVNEPEDVRMIEQGMNRYIALHAAAQSEMVISSFSLEQLATLREKYEDITGYFTGYVSREARVVLPIIGIFMLVLACFNYINIAIVSAAKRLKEIGVRKVIGANRQLVIVQFLTENIFVTLFALLLGITLAISIFLPWFNQTFSLFVNLSPLDHNLWLYLTSILLFTGIASGLYPAFYISKFTVVNIMKGSVRFGKKNPLTKIILGLQLILACITITNGVIFTQNINYQANRSWGYNQNDALYTPVPDLSGYDQLYAAMSQNPNVLSMSGSCHHLGKDKTSVKLQMPDRTYEVRQMAVDANYLKTMQLELKEGRAFIDHQEADKQTVMVNELLVKNLGLIEPIGQVVKIDSNRYEVIGVIKDFHIHSFYDKIRPTIVTLADRKDYNYLTMKVRPGSEIETYDALQGHWTHLFPENPFQGGFQRDILNWYFNDIASHAKIMKVIATIAILLAGLGLYGLVTLNASGRVREFSIRKALGAGFKSIVKIITKQYVILFTVALGIGAPISYIMIEAMLGMVYPDDTMPMNFSGVLIAIGSLVFVLFVVVFNQAGRVSNSNPVNGLKVE
ncbi:MAG: ABC transporter permease [Reichenbachiella sp.]|uniref:ABC transporter permease n=1 Tax=Reichenbachiella sp. TaxID=2184521 RepID=UPI0032671EAC